MGVPQRYTTQSRRGTVRNITVRSFSYPAPDNGKPLAQPPEDSHTSIQGGHG